jgi:hypothetical protein
MNECWPVPRKRSENSYTSGVDPKKLLQVFSLENPGVVDFKLLTDFPKRGVLTVDGEVWKYELCWPFVRFADDIKMREALRVFDN